jgi:SHS2 domain-containing protein
MTDTERVRYVEEDGLEVGAQDEEALLYSWLEELLLRFEVEGKLYSRFKVDSIERTPQGYVLEARMWGEPFDRERHVSKTDVKAVTYHRMEILKSDAMVTVKYILDI